MDIQTEFQISKREWENIKVSLEMCGDTGDFNLKKHLYKRPDLMRNLIEMENKILTYDYSTLEAAFVFAELASKAGEKLGLVGEFARTFGSGYSWVRTGWFDLRWINLDRKVRLKDYVINQVFFFRLFFESDDGDFGWDFDSPEVRRKLKLTFDKFYVWQSHPESHIEDFMCYKSELVPLWHGLSLILDSPVGRC
ncbi:MAG: hypothetical protein HYW01_03210 [Deltaproteobacteria bacterium]|nr:hypothetical protein [Deltaproteobacteria bacterium]